MAKRSRAPRGRTAPPNPYGEWGITVDDETAQWLVLQASRCNGAMRQGDDMRSLELLILRSVRDRVPKFFDQWVRAHWPDEREAPALSRALADSDQATGGGGGMVFPDVADINGAIEAAIDAIEASLDPLGLQLSDCRSLADLLRACLERAEVRLSTDAIEVEGLAPQARNRLLPEVAG